MTSTCQATDGAVRRQDLKLLDYFRVAPALPPGGEATPPPPVATLELTYLDIIFFSLPPVQRLFLYRLPAGDRNSGRDFFVESHLPHLKLALSYALAVFYPLAGHLVKTDPDTVPVIRYEEGDAVAVRVVETQDDFEEVAGDAPKESSRLFSLVPDLTAPDDKKRPLLEVQVTLFPGSAVALGVTVSHAAADGSSSVHFLKTWAAFSRQLQFPQGDIDGSTNTNHGAAQVLPIFDRSLVHDPKGLREIYFADLMQHLRKISSTTLTVPTIALRRATFPLSPADLDVLRRRAAQPPGLRYSSFTVVCALVWVCHVKARGKLDDAHKVFSFAANLRPRIQPPLPGAYFGNCLGGGLAQVRTADLVGDAGLAVAAAAIWEQVNDLRDGGLVIRLGEKVVKVMVGHNWSEAISVAGSPSLGVYEVDFGWGRPTKVEVVSCEVSGGISLAETADGRGGIEVGIPLSPENMVRFESCWRSALETGS